MKHQNYFLRKIKMKKNKVSSAAVFVWFFKGKDVRTIRGSYIWLEQSKHIHFLLTDMLNNLMRLR